MPMETLHLALMAKGDHRWVWRQGGTGRGGGRWKVGPSPHTVKVARPRVGAKGTGRRQWTW